MILRETIRKTAEGEGKWVRVHTEPLEYAYVDVRVEPLPRGSVIEYSEAVQAELLSPYLVGIVPDIRRPEASHLISSVGWFAIAAGAVILIVRLSLCTGSAVVAAFPSLAAALKGSFWPAWPAYPCR